ncbi:MAG: DegV family protein [Acidimicrobiia bacterium]
MSRVRIVTDSACDLPDSIAAELGIEIVPLTIRFGDTEYTDRVDLTPTQFWAKCAASPVLPSTAAPSPGAFEAVFRSLAADGATGIVCINLSAGLSATMQSAELAARAVGDQIEVRVIDSASVTIGLGMICVDCARLADDGASIDVIEARARDLASRTHVWGALDTLENLKKGGRIGGAKALVASVLSIKPIIEVVNGKVEEGGKQRTRAKALSFLIDQVTAAGEIENLAVMHAACPDVDQFVAKLRPLSPTGDIVVGDIGAVIGAHAGQGTIGVVFQSKRS